MKTINKIFELFAGAFLVAAILLCDVIWAKCALAGAYFLRLSREEE